MKILKRTMITILVVISGLFICVFIFMNTKQFGRIPKGERLELIKKSPNYRHGKFQNIHETKQLTPEKYNFITY